MASEYIRAELTQALLAIRYTFLCLSVLALLLYTIHCCRCSKGPGVRYEQASTFYLCLSLVFFNDPLFAVYVFHPGVAASLFFSLSVSVFMICLLNYWMRMLEFIAIEEEPQRSPIRTLLCILVLLSVFGSQLAYQLLVSE